LNDATVLLLKLLVTVLVAAALSAAMQARAASDRSRPEEARVEAVSELIGS
jgi:hypothetical protein